LGAGSDAKRHIAIKNVTAGGFIARVIRDVGISRGAGGGGGRFIIRSIGLLIQIGQLDVVGLFAAVCTCKVVQGGRHFGGGITCRSGKGGGGGGGGSIEISRRTFTARVSIREQVALCWIVVGAIGGLTKDAMLVVVVMVVVMLMFGRVECPMTVGAGGVQSVMRSVMKVSKVLLNKIGHFFAEDEGSFLYRKYLCASG